MKQYTIAVPYSYSDCCYMGEDTAEVTLFAKSEEQARELAKEYVSIAAYVYETHSTEIINVEEP